MADYTSYLDQVAKDLGVPTDQARAIYELETSGGRNVRRSSAGAQGHMQLMPATARELGVRDINDPLQNIRGGVQYYGQQLRKFGEPSLAAAAYNAGPGRVQRAGGVPNIPETRSYVSRFQTMLQGAKPPAAKVPQMPYSDPNADTTEDDGDLGSLGVGALGGGAAGNSAFNTALQRGYANLQAAQNAEALSAKQEYEAAQKRLAERSGVSQSEMLLRLSKALLSPSYTRGFGGTLNNLMGAFGDIATASRTAEEKRAEQEAELRSQFNKFAGAQRTANARDYINMMKLYGAANKAPTAKGNPIVLGKDQTIVNARYAFAPPSLVSEGVTDAVWAKMTPQEKEILLSEKGL